MFLHKTNKNKKFDSLTKEEAWNEVKHAVSFFKGGRFGGWAGGFFDLGIIASLFTGTRFSFWVVPILIASTYFTALFFTFISFPLIKATLNYPVVTTNDFKVLWIYKRIFENKIIVMIIYGVFFAAGCYLNGYIFGYKK